MMRKKAVDEQIVEILRAAHWTEQAAQELAESSHVITYVKGSPIFHAGEPADLLYVLLSGEAKVYYSSAAGERLLIDIVGPGQLLGYPHWQQWESGDATQRWSVEAMSTCVVALITRTRVASTARRLPLDALGEMVRDLSVEWSRLCERALLYLTMDVRGRLAVAIDDISKRFGIGDARGVMIPLRLSHEDFGELVGASRPMVSKHLKDLADGGVFFKSGGRYVLARREALHAAPSVPSSEQSLPPRRAALKVVGGSKTAVRAAR